MNHKFKPFDKVLVRGDRPNAMWRPRFYAYFHEGVHYTADGDYWPQCIFYEGNEELLGTTNSPETEFKRGDAVLVWDEGDFHKKIRIYSRYDGRFHRHVVLDCLFSNKSADEYMFDYAEKFVPATVEGQEGS